MTGARLILVTTPQRAEAKRIAHALVEERLAACVNLIGGVHSVYRWNEAVETADEVLLRQFRLHLHRGISHLATPQAVRSIADLVHLAIPAQRASAARSLARRVGLVLQDHVR